MIRLCKYNQERVLENVHNGKLDLVALSSTSLIDDIILEMYQNQIFDCLKNNITDLRSHNTTVPYELIWACAITAKMKVKTSLSDVPFAISDHRTLAKLGYTLLDSNKNLKDGLMREGTLRFLLDKYNPSLFIGGYNDTVQKGILPKMDIIPDIHILDCTEIEVNFSNGNYEGSEVSYSDKQEKLIRGYKLATIRGIVDDTGIIEEIAFGNAKIHDLKLSEKMLKTSPVLKPGDILINDRGFISREIINYLKSKRGVDTYVPLRSNMNAYQLAVSIATAENNWKTHPNKKRKNQYVATVPNIGNLWLSSNPEEDVPINSCVVWDRKDNSYFVFVTTNMNASGRDIIRTYELRPEIEEDYRQLKDFWKIEDFKSTKLNVILFHMVCVLFGYLFFQLYTLMPEGEKYLHKSLPVVLKNYTSEIHPYVVLYSGYEFGVLTLFELMELYAHSSDEVRKIFESILK